MIKDLVRAMLTASAALAFSSDAVAGIAGDQLRQGSAPIILACTYNSGASAEVVSGQLSVSVSSRVLINATVMAHYVTAEALSGTMQVTLAQNATIIGQTGLGYMSDLGTSDIGGHINEYLSQTASYSDPALVLAPGIYTIRLSAAVTKCYSPGDTSLIGGTLSWTLVSSAYDRIYADGFGATG